MQLKPVVPGQLAVAEQPRPEDLAPLADQGYKTVIGNRPDGEAVRQPSSEQIASAAERLGMHYVHIPVNVDDITREDVDAFRESLVKKPSPAFAHCGSGKRSFLLWAAGEVLYEGRSTDELVEKGRVIGLDVSSLPPLVQRIM